MSENVDNKTRRKAVRRNAWLLALVAVGFFSAFILAQVWRAQGG